MSATWRVAISVLVPTGSGCRSDLLKGLDEMADPRGDIRVDVGELDSVPGRSGHAHHAPVGVDGRRLLAQGELHLDGRSHAEIAGGFHEHPALAEVQGQRVLR